MDGWERTFRRAALWRETGEYYVAEAGGGERRYSSSSNTKVDLSCGGGDSSSSGRRCCRSGASMMPDWIVKQPTDEKENLGVRGAQPVFLNLIYTTKPKSPRDCGVFFRICAHPGGGTGREGVANGLERTGYASERDTAAGCHPAIMSVRNSIIRDYR